MHCEQSLCLCALESPSAAWGEPNEFACPTPCGEPANEPSEVAEPELCATPGEPNEFAAPAFCAAPGKGPKKLPAPIPPAVPYDGDVLPAYAEAQAPLALWLALK